MRIFYDFNKHKWILIVNVYMRLSLISHKAFNLYLNAFNIPTFLLYNAHINNAKSVFKWTLYFWTDKIWVAQRFLNFNILYLILVFCYICQIKNFGFKKLNGLIFFLEKLHTPFYRYFIVILNNVSPTISIICST